MHRPAAIEVAPSPDKRGEYSRTASRPYSAAARAPVSWSARSAPDEVRVLFKQHQYLLQRTVFECTAAPNPTRDGPMGHRFDWGDVSCIDWHQRHVVVCLMLSVVWLSSLPGIRSCVVRHGLGSRLGQLGLFAFCSFSLSGFDSFNQNLKEKTYIEQLNQAIEREPGPWRSSQLRTPRRLDCRHQSEENKRTRCRWCQSIQRPSTQPNPWRMGPSLIELTGAVHSKIVPVCCSKYWCCLSSTRTLSSADLPFHDTGALAAAESGRLAGWKHAPLSSGLGVARLYRSWTVHQSLQSLNLSRFDFSFCSVTRILRCLYSILLCRLNSNGCSFVLGFVFRFRFSPFL